MGDCSYHTVGIIGMILYIPLVLLCSRNMLFVHREEGHLGLKTSFHMFLWSYLIFDLIFTIIVFQEHKITLSTYVVHEVAMYFDAIAFAIIVYFWSDRFIDDNTRKDRVRNFVKFTIAGYGIILFIAIIAVVSDQPKCDNSFCLTSYIILAAISGFILFLLSSIMLSIGCRVLYRLSNHFSSEMVQGSLPMNVLIRFNFVLFTSTICYTFRVFAESFEIYKSISHRHLILVTEIGHCHTLSFLITKWIPFVIPSALFLYLMRPRVPGASKTSTLKFNAIANWTSKTDKLSVNTTHVLDAEVSPLSFASSDNSSSKTQKNEMDLSFYEQNLRIDGDKPKVSSLEKYYHSSIVV